MIELNIINTVGIIFSGLLIGFLSGLFGVGGGFLMTPILRIIFGIPYNLAVGSDLLAITFTSLYGSFKHYKLRHTNILLGIIILIGMFPGVEIGARILNRLKFSSNILINGKEILLVDIVLNLCYFILLSLAAFIMLIEYLKWSKENKIPVDLSTYKTNYYF
ncbi:MAG: sulfite exporter TauE/SafE family protein, partial [bacterium]